MTPKKVEKVEKVALINLDFTPPYATISSQVDPSKADSPTHVGVIF